MQTFLYFGIFWGGLFVGYMLHHWIISMKSFDGVMRVTKDEEKTVYSLELTEDPDMLAYQSLVIFKVITDLKIDPTRD
jgi:hypothetical protein